MKKIIIACRTIEHELMQAMENCGCKDEVIWLESGLHATPKRLTKVLQKHLDERKDAEQFLLAMGFCGNALVGIYSETAQLIVPRVDDCITLLLGDLDTRKKIAQKYAAYFLTRGWMNGERNIWVEYQYMETKYGKKKAREISEMMYSHYKTLVLLDSGVDDMDLLMKDTKEIADVLGLEQRQIRGTLNYLEQLLKENWTKDRFIIKQPGEILELHDLQFV